tara:strand:- start:785 stop:1144 length:360 start_codon:yes stop_codon:yes gene_type:complete
MNNKLFYANGKTNKRMNTTRASGAVRYWVVSGKTAWETDEPNGSQIGSKFDVSSVFGTKYADIFDDAFRKAHEIKNSTPSKLATPTKTKSSDDSRLDKLEKNLGDISDALAIILKNQAK